ncbi:fused MFS/spermidine synthase [Arthrobacter sp. MSA 4-2]|uniref:spermidine synthase n=1 Tax=Arthrobacter sp. MSA 4-2 TaxID=2794349 RepID=UPI0018E84644|nr:fused MFS/spermidine synthase [Arthrobacter sp. MSA 4-2]MBJ2120039.1 fused MFS/spermidine synthase [Arthrobacter sp. MSA 4-2]
MNTGDSVPTRWLRGVGAHAEIDEDAFLDGAYILSIGGAQQSHVNLAEPSQVFYEYLRRIANVIDVVRPPGEPLRVLHLGAGALTLVRYVQATRPGSEQTAVELERELLDFVLEHLPLPEGTQCRVLLDDAAAALDGLPAAGFDAIVLDVFAGADAPAHLTEAPFYRRLLELAAPGGVVLVNVGDDPPLGFARRQVRTLAGEARGIAALGETAMFTGRYPGNIVIAARRESWPADWTGRLLAAGPHPAAVLTGLDLDAFASGTGG